MNTQKATTIILIGLTAFVAGVIGIKYLVTPTPPVALESAESTTPSKTDQRILRAQREIQQGPEMAEAYNQLASAYMQKARETNDFAFNGKAEDAINRSLSVQPDNYNALKLRAKLQLTYHRFAEALETARRAQSVREDDNDVWGLMTDALVELGDYPRAIEAAQRMVDLRPASSSYARISYLRSLHGDTVGAIQAMRSALRPQTRMIGKRSRGVTHNWETNCSTKETWRRPRRSLMKPSVHSQITSSLCMERHALELHAAIFKLLSKSTGWNKASATPQIHRKHWAIFTRPWARRTSPELNMRGSRSLNVRMPLSNDRGATW